MTTPNAPPSDVPSARRLLLTTAIAAASATVILIAAVLPAEVGIDPIGSGRLLGLTALSTTPVATESAAPPGTAMTLIQDGPVVHASAEYKIDSVELVLGPYQFVEYKYRLEKGASMLYAWTATATPIYDFHADPDGTPKPSPVSFDKRPKREARGAYTASFPGIHGWYWENPGGDSMRISLQTAGFYSTATEFRSDRTRRTHELTSLPRLHVEASKAPEVP